MKTAVHFGAGNIGRGFIGDILHESGYRVIFVDVDAAMCEQLNATNSYDLYLIDHAYSKKVVDNICAINSLKQEDAVIHAIMDANLITSSVWANNLPKIAPILAKGLKARLSAGCPRVNIMACENAMFGTDILKRAMIDCGISEAELDSIGGYPNTAVDRVVIGAEKDGITIVNIADYHELAVEQNKLIDPSDLPIQNARYTNSLQKFLERKLYVINCGHAWAGYLGYINGYESAYDVFTTPALTEEVRKAMRESAKLISEKYDFTEQEMMDYVDFGIKRYQTPGVNYSISMVTRSPIRKLAPSERLAGPCVQCAERGLENTYLLKGIALVLLLDRNDDAEAVELQKAIQDIGLAGAVEKYAGIPKGSDMQTSIIGFYEELKKVRDAKRGELIHNMKRRYTI
jgi:mannitol-1-phosphate 5-dehydrogenase